MQKNKKQRIERFEKWADRILGELRADFFVKEYNWSTTYKKDTNTENENIAAQIEIDMKYLNYHITMYKPLRELYEKKMYQKCFEVLIHEMSHLYTEPLYLLAIDAVTNTSKQNLELVREQQTQRIAGCISEFYPRKKYLPKKYGK